MPAVFRSAPSRRGFSLIEIMVAVAITAILVVLITKITVSFLDYWPKAEGKLRKNMDARMVLELMAQDLQAAIFRSQGQPNTFEWFQWRYDTNALPKTIYQSSDAGMLMFFTSPSDRDLTTNGNICGINYRLAYQDPLKTTGTDRVFALYRTMATAQTTFDSILGQTDLYQGYWKSQDTLSSKNFLIANVLDLSLNFQVQQPDGTRMQLPARTSLRYGPTLQATPAVNGLSTGARITAIDIALTITTKQGSQRIKEGQSNLEGLLVPTIDTYTRRVELRY